MNWMRESPLAPAINSSNLTGGSAARRPVLRRKRKLKQRGTTAANSGPAARRKNRRAIPAADISTVVRCLPTVARSAKVGPLRSATLGWLLKNENTVFSAGDIEVQGVEREPLGIYTNG